MKKIIHQYKLRLTNLSQGNRSLRLPRLSARRDIDLMNLSFLNQLSSREILEKIIAGKDVILIKKLSSRDEQLNQVDRRLNQVFREAETIFGETGAYDLFLGYPFAEGKFLDDNIARAPVLLFPVRLERNFQQSPRWKLSASGDTDFIFNRAFFLAYEKFQRHRFKPEFWNDRPEKVNDLQDLLNWLYNHLKTHEAELHFNQDLFQFELRPFRDLRKEDMERFGTGKIKFQPHAVLGIFPQSDSALLQDYELIEDQPQKFDVEQFFVPRFSPDADAYVREEERFFVTPVDETQEKALLKVKQGNHVVIHGPPGTGKSQVIVNLVADAMARGKRVLVVSQKRAALDVVFHRLATLGLRRFAALVHDYRSDRSRIYAQIRRQIEDVGLFRQENQNLDFSRWERDFRLNSRSMDQLSVFFDALHEALTAEQSCGMTVHELYLLADPKKRMISVGDAPAKMDLPGLEELLRRLEHLLGYRALLMQSHPWFRRKDLSALDYDGRQAFRDFLRQLPQVVNSLAEKFRHFPFPDADPFNQDRIRQYIRNFNQVRSLLEQKNIREALHHFCLAGHQPSNMRKKLESIRKLAEKMQKQRFLKGFSWASLDDLEKHIRTYEKGEGSLLSWLQLEFLKARWYIRKIVLDKKDDFEDADLKKLKSELKDHQRMLKYFMEVEDDVFLNDMPSGEKADEILRWADEASAVFEHVVTVLQADLPKGSPEFCTKEGFDSGGWSQASGMADEMAVFHSNWEQEHREWQKYLHTEQIKFILDGIREDDPGKADVLADAFEADMENLVELDRLRGSFTGAEAPVSEALIEVLQSETETATAVLTHRVRNSFYLKWIEQAERKHPELQEVTGIGIDAKRREYCERNEQRMLRIAELAARRLKEQVLDRIEYNRLKNPVTYRDILHQTSKKRMIWPLRRLIEAFWNEGLQELVPCWLASPESAAAIFPMEKGMFDLVVFDEASQCYVERALPVLLRGKTAAVAGDEKQLQPFDLYQVRYDDDEDAFFSEVPAVEAESVLDLAKNTFSGHWLGWHYRSLEADLINFSNYAFYENRLNVMPPAHHGFLSGPPIEFIRVEGKWQKNTNVEEAEKVIDIIERFVKSDEPPSMGVVTFNFHQMELIRDKIEQRLQEVADSGDEELLKKYYASLYREEDEEQQGIFVKNIENVQGDERDVIIFSPAYAPDAAGRLVARFGTLNMSGGENRLNVAITRARLKVIMLCSFDPEILEVEHTLHPGPRLLKAYLRYAKATSAGDKVTAGQILKSVGPEHTSLAAPAAGVIQVKESLSERVYEKLTKAGWEVKRQVGDTTWKVDLGVVDPGDGSRFLLAIECEGANYFSGTSPKEREIYRPDLLRQRGWQTHRVWARNFFLDEEKEMKKIFDLLEEIKSR